MVQRASASLPSIYIHLLTTLEPTLAFLGALTNLITPPTYLSSLTRHTIPYDPGTSFLYTQLSGAWLYFAFNSAFVLRKFDDVKLWKYLICGMLLSDLAYCHSCAEAVGGWGAWIDVSQWTREDWTVFVTTAPFVATRLLIVLGVGVTEDKGKMT